MIKDRTKRHRQTAPTGGKSMTEQHHAKSCDINTIVSKYAKTGLVSHVNRHSANYGDVSGADFERAMELVCDQTTIFEELPAQVRAHYENDVVQYLDATGTPEGAEEHRLLLHPKQAPEEPVEAPKEPQTVTEEPVT